MPPIDPLIRTDIIVYPPWTPPPTLCFCPPAAGAGGSPPSGPISLSLASGSVILTWTDTATETGYAVQRSLDGITYNNYANTIVNVVTYTDTLVSTPNTYWYQVAAYNAFGTSSFSNTASITFTAPVGPSLCKASTFPPQYFSSSLIFGVNYDLV